MKAYIPTMLLVYGYTLSFVCYCFVIILRDDNFAPSARLLSGKNLRIMA